MHIRRACAARVTLRVCVCPAGPSVFLLQQNSDTNGFIATLASFQRKAIFVLLLREKQVNKPIGKLAAAYFDRSACSVYLGGARSHNEGHVSTPACQGCRFGAMTPITAPCSFLRVESQNRGAASALSILGTGHSAHASHVALIGPGSAACMQG